MKKINTGFASVFGALSLSLSFADTAQACLASDVALRQRGDIAIDARTGAVLYASNENERFYQASLTKRMTLLLTLRALKDGTLARDQVINLPSHFFRNSYGSPQEGDPVPYTFTKMTVENALLAMNVRSSNRAPYALAQAISGTESNFVTLMNETAASLDMNGTRFANSNGFPVRDVFNRHYTTAADHAKLVQALYAEFPDDMAGLNPGHVRVEAFDARNRRHTIPLDSSNRLLAAVDGPYSLPNVIGGKTGYACAAGPAIDVEAMIDDRLVIYVSGGHQSSASRNQFVYNLIRNPTQDFMERLSQSRLMEMLRGLRERFDQMMRPPSFNIEALGQGVVPLNALTGNVETLIVQPHGQTPDPLNEHLSTEMPVIVDRSRREAAPWQPSIL